MKKQTEIPLQNQIQCVAREIAMRLKYYPGRVAKGTMLQAAADDETNAMRAVLNTLQHLEVQGRGILYDQHAAAEGIIEEWIISLDPSLEQALIAKGKMKVPPLIKAIYVDGLLDAVVNLRPASRIASKPVFTLPLLYRCAGYPDTPPHPQYVFQRVETQSVQQRIAAFCEAFERATGNKYKVPGKDAKAWAGKEYQDVPADRELLDFYMKCTEFPINGPKGIADYLRNYQGTVQLQQRALAGPADKFPAYFDKHLMDELSKSKPAQWQAYRTHLVSLGYVRTANPAVGETWKLKTDGQ